MLKIFLPAFLSITTISLCAQEAFHDNRESFDNLPKGAIRKEVACFSTAGEDEKNNSIKPGKATIVKSGKNYSTFKYGNVTVNIKIKSFDRTKYKIKRNADGHVTKINDKFVFGTDGGLPSTAFQSVEIIIDTDTVRLPQRAYADLFQPRICVAGGARESNDTCPKIFISSDKKRIYIFSWHSDGAGAYEVTWVIRDKKYLRRVVDYAY